MTLYCGNLAVVHEDGRRALSEFNSPEGGFSVQQIRVRGTTAQTLGNHYHKNKHEVFTLLRGSAVLVVQQVDPATGSVVPQTRESFALRSGATWQIPAWMAHTVVAEPGAILHCVSSAPYDESDKDMTAVSLVKNEDAAQLFDEFCGKMSWPAEAPVSS